MLILGLSMAALSLISAFFVILSIVLAPEEARVDSTTAALACLALGVGLGGALAWQAGNALLSRASARFRLPPVWLFLLVYLAALVTGQLMLSFDLLPLVTFPPFHVIAAVSPPLVILALIGHTFRPADFRWREIVVHLASGGFVAATIALTLEIIAGLVVLIISLLITALTPGGLERLAGLATNLEDPTWLENPENALSLLTSPPIAITLAVVFIVLAPFIEEAAKIVGVAAMSYRRPTLARAFMWGVAGGAGFSLFENLFNTVTGLEMWTGVILMRIGATLMHCLGSGLMAIGWYYLLAEGRPWKLVRAYLASLVIHGAWNGLIIGITGTALLAADSPAQTLLALSGGVALFLITLLLALTLGMVLAFVIITRRLRAGLIENTFQLANQRIS